MEYTDRLIHIYVHICIFTLLHDKYIRVYIVYMHLMYQRVACENDEDYDDYGDDDGDYGDYGDYDDEKDRRDLGIIWGAPRPSPLIASSSRKHTPAHHEVHHDHDDGGDRHDDGDDEEEQLMTN